MDALFLKLLDTAQELTLRKQVLIDIKQKFAQGHSIVSTLSLLYAKMAL